MSGAPIKPASTVLSLTSLENDRVLQDDYSIFTRLEHQYNRIKLLEDMRGTAESAHIQKMLNMMTSVDLDLETLKALGQYSHAKIQKKAANLIADAIENKTGKCDYYQLEEFLKSMKPVFQQELLRRLKLMISQQQFSTAQLIGRYYDCPDENLKPVIVKTILDHFEHRQLKVSDLRTSFYMPEPAIVQACVQCILKKPPQELSKIEADHLYSLPDEAVKAHVKDRVLYFSKQGNSRT